MNINDVLSSNGVWFVLALAWAVATVAKAILARKPELRLRPGVRLSVLLSVIAVAVGASFLSFYEGGPLLLQVEGFEGLAPWSTVVVGVSVGSMELGGYKLLSRVVDLGVLPPKWAGIAKLLLQRSADFREKTSPSDVALDEPSHPSGSDAADPENS